MTAAEMRRPAADGTVAGGVLPLTAPDELTAVRAGALRDQRVDTTGA